MKNMAVKLQSGKAYMLPRSRLLKRASKMQDYLSLAQHLGACVPLAELTASREAALHRRLLSESSRTEPMLESCIRPANQTFTEPLNIVPTMK